MLASRQNKKNTPYDWQGGDVSTFSQQSQNLADQAGDAGLNTSQIDVQRRTAEAEQKAGQTAQNTAQGASEVAKGADVDPTVAQLNVDGGSSQTIQPYKEKTAAPDSPGTDVQNNADFSKESTFKDPLTEYLKNLFNGDLPDSIKRQIDKSFLNPNYVQPLPSNLVNDQPFYQVDNNGLQNAFQDYLEGISGNYKNILNNPNDYTQFKNAIGNQLNSQLQNIEQEYLKGQSNIAKQTNEKQKAISDYINKLSSGLKDYQDRTQNLSNIGQLSDLEKAAAAQNGVLAGQGVTGTAALNALSQGAGVGNSRLQALSQQAQNAAIQKAEGEAGAAQSAAKTGAEIQAAGQAAQQKAYKDAGDTISKNQENLLNKLKDNTDKAKQDLTDAYNQSKTNLTKQEQDYINQAQDKLRNASIPEETIKTAANTFAQTVKNYLSKNADKLSQKDKDALRTNLEGIWRIAVGTHQSDINFSNDISNILLPIAQSIGEDFQTGG